MRASAILWIAALGGACGDDAKQPGSTAAPEPAISETRLPTASGDIVLRLLDQGAEPRRLLRYDLKDWKGGKAAMEMEISLAMRMEEDEEPRRMDIPPVRMVMAYSPVVETEDGNLRTEFSMEVAEMDPDSPLAEDRGMDIKGWTVIRPPVTSRTSASSCRRIRSRRSSGRWTACAKRFSSSRPRSRGSRSGRAGGGS